MKSMLSLCCAALVALAWAAPSAHAQACQQQIEDWGDAPECIPAYPSGVLGHFPTCVLACSPGTQELFCTPISLLPGPTGFIRHVLPAGVPHYWLGCYSGPVGLAGIDAEADGKVNTPPVGVSACSASQPTDCVEPIIGGPMAFDQDECFSDTDDHGVDGPVVFPTCALSTITLHTANCGPPTQAWLNICVDWNEDGDWNDNFECPAPVGQQICAYEWAVKNLAIPVPPGCGTFTTPSFQTGPKEAHTWFRVSLTPDPVPDDYPWNGSASVPLLAYQNGETEDYPAIIVRPLPTSSGTWGKVKATYR